MDRAQDSDSKQGRSQWYIGVPNGVVLCVDHADGYQMSGRMYHAYRKEAVSYTDISRVLFEMEDFFDSLRFPFPSVNGRTFQGKELPMRPEKERVKVMSDEELLNKHGDLGTFVIRVQHRQNSTWQGRITWMDQDKTMHFRSVWEMVKLIESAMETAGDEEKPEEKGWLEEEERPEEGRPEA